MVREIEILDITPASRLQSLRQTHSIVGCCQQVNVIGHPHISVHGQSEALRGLDQAITKELVVGFCREDHLAVISAQYDMLRLTEHKVARQAGQKYSCLTLFTSAPWRRCLQKSVYDICRACAGEQSWS